MFNQFQFSSKFVSLLLGGALILVLLAAVPSVAGAASSELSLSFNDLEDLGPGWTYEGWLIVEGAPVSTGVFTVDASGTPSVTEFTADSSNLEKATAFVLTIEPSPDTDPAPSPVHVLGGDFANGAAQLTLGHAAALGNDFASASGNYVLAAPSAGAEANYVNGVWWLDPAAGPGPSLNLPELPAGWVYEGWVVGSKGPISTGRFTTASGADSDGAGPMAGPEAAPPFPGQDFVNPAKDLTAGYMAVITIEPEPDNSPAPFTLKPLIDQTIDDVGQETLQDMANNASSFPTGSATFAAMAGETSAPATTAEQAPAALPATGADQSVPVLPLAVAVGGVLLLGAGVALRSYLHLR